MLTYDQYAGGKEWNPRIVDELELDELFWLPLVRNAKMTAAMQAAPKEKPLQHLTG